MLKTKAAHQTGSIMAIFEQEPSPKWFIDWASRRNNVPIRRKEECDVSTQVGNIIQSLLEKFNFWTRKVSYWLASASIGRLRIINLLESFTLICNIEIRIQKITFESIKKSSSKTRLLNRKPSFTEATHPEISLKQ